METYRRVVEIHTGAEKNLFRTFRIDVPDGTSARARAKKWAEALDKNAERYETQVRFVPPRDEDVLPGYDPPIRGEKNWDWAGEEEIDW